MRLSQTLIRTRLRSFCSCTGLAAFTARSGCPSGGVDSVTSTSADVIAAVRDLALIANDNFIAAILNRNSLVTGNGNRWTRERVTSLRSHHHIAVYKSADDGIEPWLNLSKAAQLLRVAPKTLRLAAEAGEIEAVHPLPDGPWIFSRSVLSSTSGRIITERARQNSKYPAGTLPNQQSLFPSAT